jgi:hypothetical protein
VLLRDIFLPNVGNVERVKRSRGSGSGRRGSRRAKFPPILIGRSPRTRRKRRIRLARVTTVSVCASARALSGPQPIDQTPGTGFNYRHGIEHHVFAIAAADDLNARR